MASPIYNGAVNVVLSGGPVSAMLRNQNKWCPRCANVLKHTIEDCKRLAEERGGECLSTEYKNGRSHMEWQCGEGHHPWKATFHQIKSQGTWCPYCVNKQEQMVRKTIEDVTGLDFLISYPKWLNGLQLDGYCEEEKIAFEYQGGQHYEFIQRFHKTEENFHKLQERDKRKAKLCRENNVKLIIVPFSIKDVDLWDFIWERVGV